MSAGKLACEYLTKIERKDQSSAAVHQPVCSSLLEHVVAEAQQRRLQLVQGGSNERFFTSANLLCRAAGAGLLRDC